MDPNQPIDEMHEGARMYWFARTVREYQQAGLAHDVAKIAAAWGVEWSQAEPEGTVDVLGGEEPAEEPRGVTPEDTMRIFSGGRSRWGRGRGFG